MSSFSEQKKLPPALQGTVATQQDDNREKTIEKPLPEGPKTPIGKILSRVIILLEERQKRLHLKNLCINLAFYIFLLKTLDGFSSGLVIAVLFLLAFILTLRFVLVKESLKEENYILLKEMTDHESLSEYINRIRKKAPRIGWGFRCFHYENQSSTVITHEKSQRFSYKKWRDVSEKATDDILHHSIVKLDCEITWSCPKSETYERYLKEKFDFLESHKLHDYEFSWWDSLTVDGYHDKRILLSSPEECPLLLGEKQYRIASYLGVSWLYLLWLDLILKPVRFRFKKEVM